MSTELPVLIADDDSDDQLMLKDAFKDCGIYNQIHFLENGIDLMYYLNRAKNSGFKDMPALILLDLNMPKKDGREVLVEIKSDPVLKFIPVVIFTTSKSLTDIRSTYSNGANSYVAKPSTYEELLEIIRNIGEYWLKINILAK